MESVFSFQYVFPQSKSYNITGNETCDPPEREDILTGNCSFPVVWYFRESGPHVFLLLVTNGINRTAELVGINVYDAKKQTSVSFVLLPALSGAAILAISLAALLFYRVYSTNSSIETADFNFDLDVDEDDDYEVSVQIQIGKPRLSFLRSSQVPGGELVILAPFALFCSHP